MSEKRTILVVDDNPLVRQNVILMVRKSFPELEVLEAERVDAALETVSTYRPLIMITETHVKDKSGLLLTEIVASRYPDTVVAVFTICDSPEYKAEAMKRGADFFISKTEPDGATLLKMIATCLSEDKKR